MRRSLLAALTLALLFESCGELAFASTPAPPAPPEWRHFDPKPFEGRAPHARVPARVGGVSVPNVPGEVFILQIEPKSWLRCACAIFSHIEPYCVCQEADNR